MNYKSILVHIDDRPTCSTRTAAAVGLAAQHQSPLTGIYIISQMYFSHHRAEFVARAEAARKKFEEQAAKVKVRTEWILVDCQTSRIDLINALNLHAHYHDLLVLSQTDSSADEQGVPDNLPEKAVLGSGRPVLIVPYAGRFKNEYKQILMAWRGGPESCRALHDSMPILRRADHVRVVTVHGPGGDEAFHAHKADISQHMARYELPLSCEKRVSGDLSIGDLLLNMTADCGADLLVMGATSQTRRGQQTLGETGRHLLKCMTLPVLMSH
ncbi:universal stress protein [Pelovirga terrestris]|uniref:Universal stress protein n=1 Tax=Pelovirga terrestris TaxID=2771352 RepID=A0A8J6UGY2_9BACT|nr:universal stress protein [Pelovirga terrestris]MBD1400603.1 universal stress protein [Pelovirga terrestris]